MASARTSDAARRVVPVLPERAGDAHARRRRVHLRPQDHARRPSAVRGRPGRVRRPAPSGAEVPPQGAERATQSALPVWVEDPHFDLDFHVRRAAPPSPGGRSELTDYAQRIPSRPPSTGRGRSGAVRRGGSRGRSRRDLLKVHHAMIDGLAGVQLAAALWDLSAGCCRRRRRRPGTPSPSPRSRTCSATPSRSSRRTLSGR